MTSAGSRCSMSLQPGAAQGRVTVVHNAGAGRSTCSAARGSMRAGLPWRATVHRPWPLPRSLSSPAAWRAHAPLCSARKCFAPAFRWACPPTPPPPQACALLTESAAPPPAAPQHPPARHTGAAGRAPAWVAAGAGTCRVQRGPGPRSGCVPARVGGGQAAAWDANRSELLHPLTPARSAIARGRHAGGTTGSCGRASSAGRHARLREQRGGGCHGQPHRASSRARASAMRWFSSRASGDCLPGARAEVRRGGRGAAQGRQPASYRVVLLLCRWPTRHQLSMELKVIANAPAAAGFTQRHRNRDAQGGLASIGNPR